MVLIESIRRWIDGETTDDLLEQADESARPRRVWEEFRVQQVWDETESGHTMVTIRPASAPSTAPIIVESETDTASPGEAQGDEITVVRPRVVDLYSIELWREGVRQSVIKITKPEITIGRGSRSVAVDVPLKGDPEISRVHATLTLDDQGRYWLMPKGRNPT